MNADVSSFFGCPIDIRQAALGTRVVVEVVLEALESEGATSEVSPTCVDDFGVKWL